MIHLKMQKLASAEFASSYSTVDITERVAAGSLDWIRQYLEIGRFAFYADDVQIIANNHDGYFDFLAEDENIRGICVIVEYDDIEVFRGDAFRFEPYYHDNNPKQIEIRLRNVLARTSMIKSEKSISIHGGISALKDAIGEMVEHLNARYSPGLSAIEIDETLTVPPFKLNMPIENDLQDVLYDMENEVYLGVNSHFTPSFGTGGRIRFNLFEIRSQKHLHYIESISASTAASAEEFAANPPRFINANLKTGYVAIMQLDRILVLDINGSEGIVHEIDLAPTENRKILIRHDASFSHFDFPVHSDGRYFYLEKIDAHGYKYIEMYSPRGDRLLGTMATGLSGEFHIFVPGIRKIAFIDHGIIILQQFGFDDILAEVEIPDSETYDPSRINPVFRDGALWLYYLDIPLMKWRFTDSAYFTVNSITYPKGISLFEMLSDLAQFVDGSIYIRKGRIYIKPHHGFIREKTISADYIAADTYDREYTNIYSEMPVIRFHASGMSDDTQEPFTETTTMGAIRNYYRQNYANPRRRRIFHVPQKVALDIEIGDKITIEGLEIPESGVVTQRHLNLAENGELSKIVIEGDIE